MKINLFQKKKIKKSESIKYAKNFSRKNIFTPSLSVPYTPSEYYALQSTPNK